MDASLDAMEDIVRRIEEQSKSPEEKTGFEYATWNASIAFAAAAMYFAYLRTVGVDTPGTEEHPINEELVRIKTEMTKLQEIREAGSGKRRLEVDKVAAERMVRFYMDDPEVTEVTEEEGDEPPTAKKARASGH